MIPPNHHQNYEEKKKKKASHFIYFCDRGRFLELTRVFMPLLEPYRSPKVHHLAMRPDPAALPVAGCITNAQPLRPSVVEKLTAASGGGNHRRRHSTAAVTEIGGEKASSPSRTAGRASADTCSALMHLKAFHRQKHLPDAGVHFTTWGGKHSNGEARALFSSTAHSDFTVPPLKQRVSKYDFAGGGVARGTLSGVGVSVPSLDMTHQWDSTYSMSVAAPVAHRGQPQHRTQLVDRTRHAVEKSRQPPESWKSATSTAFSHSQLEMQSTLRDSLAARRDVLLRRSEIKPLLSLA